MRFEAGSHSKVLRGSNWTSVVDVGLNWASLPLLDSVRMEVWFLYWGFEEHFSLLKGREGCSSHLVKVFGGSHLWMSDAACVELGELLRPLDGRLGAPRGVTGRPSNCGDRSVGCLT